VQIPEKSIDVFTACLVLHHILEPDILDQVFSRVDKGLKEGGSLLLGEVDFPAGEYIRSKLGRLQEAHPACNVKINFSTRKIEISDKVTHTISEEFPILDAGDPKDAEFMATMKRVSIDNLSRSIEYIRDPAAAEDARLVIAGEQESELGGTEFFNSLPFWVDLIRKNTRLNLRSVIEISAAKILFAQKNG
jgi:hypothetical protein